VVIMILTSISVAMCVFVLNLHRFGQRGVQVPPWLNRLITRYLARLVGMTYIIKHHQRKQRSMATVSSSTNDRDMEESRPLKIQCEDLHSRYKLLQVDGGGFYILAREGEQTSLEKDDKDELNDLHRVKDKGGILKPMKAILVENANDLREISKSEKENEIMWQDIADIIDRFFFWLCFITMTTSTLCILVIMPLTKPDPRDRFVT
jgi:hypothetical protein